jgi:hypothetical protein
LITWQMNGLLPATGGGIGYADGSVVSGTINYDVTTNSWVNAGNTVAVTDPAWGPPAVPPSGCPGGTCTGSMQPGPTWYVDPFVSNPTELLMTNLDPGAGSLVGASYFSMVATQTFNGSDYPGGIFPVNTGAGNPAAQYNEMLTDSFNGIGLPTFAGTCADPLCTVNDGPAHVASPIMSYQGNDAELGLSTCPAAPFPSPQTCTSGNDGFGNNYASAYFSTIIPAGPPIGPGPSTPEPSTFFLLGGSLLAVGLRWRKSSSTK